MRNVKKWLAVAMVAAMTVSMAAGCGSKSEGEKSSGSDSEVIKIGAIGPVTGAAAVYGQAVKNGAELAVEEINAAGGINGAQVEFKFEDDEHDAEKAINAYNNLKDWGMQALLGTVTSAPCVAVGEVANQDNMFLLTPSGTAVECVQYDNAFRVCFSDPMQGLESAKYIGENGLASKVAVIYDSSDVYSTGIYEAFVKEAANQDFEVVAAEAFTSESKTDFSVQLQKAKDSGAELVFLPFYYSEASLVLKQAAGMNYNPIFFGCDGMDGILAVEGFDANLANNLMFLSPFTPTSTDEAIQKFVTAFKDKYGDTPNQFAADAYDGIYAMKAAMEKADVKPGMASSDVCDGLKSAMVEIEIDGVTAKGLTWEASGEPSKEPMVVKIENGDYAVVE
ncbi:ABC transporter substrate-binding protein [Bariatricus sp. HCP3S3_E12]|uniref:ABC transporter substrate-binding protein n=1 Tax=Bariatricus sp. HCP3S3_E12 TaxID=3438906 RepID=UPI002A97F5FB|nr:ABC transporter substrate-binding protein [bacterium]MDY5457374.1 ABC transporter substrate-binding protein [Bariatricus sp.]